MPWVLSTPPIETQGLIDLLQAAPLFPETYGPTHFKLNIHVNSLYVTPGTPWIFNKLLRDYGMVLGLAIIQRRRILTFMLEMWVQSRKCLWLSSPNPEQFSSTSYTEKITSHLSSSAHTFLDDNRVLKNTSGVYTEKVRKEKGVYIIPAIAP